jgi:hypothetical protein
MDMARSAGRRFNQKVTRERSATVSPLFPGVPWSASPLVATSAVPGKERPSGGVAIEKHLRRKVPQRRAENSLGRTGSAWAEYFIEMN